MDADRLRAAILIDHAGYVAPSGDRLALTEQTHLVTLLNWASSPYVKRLNLAFVLIDPRLAVTAVDDGDFATLRGPDLVRVLDPTRDLDEPR